MDWKQRFGRVLLVLLPGVLIFLCMNYAFVQWRAGDVVATASFNPGIAPFDIKVRKVPVPVTGSSHFIVELRRGEYIVTSQRFFWQGYTPSTVTIDWDCMEHFTVTFDQTHVATCDWKWGREATWTMSDASGLSPYYFAPTAAVPDGCPSI